MAQSVSHGIHLPLTASRSCSFILGTHAPPAILTSPIFLPSKATKQKHLHFARLYALRMIFRKSSQSQRISVPVTDLLLCCVNPNLPLNLCYGEVTHLSAKAAVITHPPLPLTLTRPVVGSDMGHVLFFLCCHCLLLESGEIILLISKK